MLTSQGDLMYCPAMVIHGNVVQWLSKVQHSSVIPISGIASVEHRKIVHTNERVNDQTRKQ